MYVLILEAKLGSGPNMAPKGIRNWLSGRRPHWRGDGRARVGRGFGAGGRGADA